MKLINFNFPCIGYTNVTYCSTSLLAVFLFLQVLCDYFYFYRDEFCSYKWRSLFRTMIRYMCIIMNNGIFQLINQYARKTCWRQNQLFSLFTVFNFVGSLNFPFMKNRKIVFLKFIFFSVFLFLQVLCDYLCRDDFKSYKLLSYFRTKIRFICIIVNNGIFQLINQYAWKTC